MRILHVLDVSVLPRSGCTFRTAELLRQHRALGCETHYVKSPKQSSVSGVHEEFDGQGFHGTQPARGLFGRLPVGYEISAFWEAAAVDLGSTREGSLRYRTTRLPETRAIQQAALEQGLAPTSPGSRRSICAEPSIPIAAHGELCSWTSFCNLAF